MTVYMRKRINTQLTFFTIFIITVVVSVISILFYDILKKQVFEDLRINACLLKEIDETQLVNFKDLRITKIDSDGIVLFDNNADIGEMDNHAYRPEIEQAKEKGFGQCVRRSDTLNRNTFYYAINLDDGKILRVAHDAASIFGIINNIIPIIILVFLVILLIIIICARFITSRLIQPIINLTNYTNDIGCSQPIYTELLPFINTIRMQHEDILKNAKMRQDFTANVSHELKTPLTAISGYAELIENDLCNTDEIIHFSKEIRHNSQRLLSLINDIIKLSELDNMDDKSSFEFFDLYDVVSKCIDMLKVTAMKNDVSLFLEKSDDIKINANREMITELVYNLCDNAIRYNNKNGRVDIYIKNIDGKKTFIVSDSGIGIAPEHQKRIFERFYRVDKSRSRQTGGTGLGLAIVKHIVSLHSASINLESKLGEGTKITIVF